MRRGCVLWIVRAVGVILMVGTGSCAPTGIRYHIEPSYSVADPQFERSMGTLLGSPFVQGNSVATLMNGDEIFPAMLAGIESAERTVTFETFIYWSGEIGRTFADALAARARAGVQVRVLIDAVGAERIDRAFVADMRAAGARVEYYHPLKLLEFGSIATLNNRTHRKLLIIDGALAFTGGAGIADQWRGHAQDPGHWRDCHYRVEGPIVGALQAAFMDMWMEETGEVLHGEEYFPALSEAGRLKAQVFMSSFRGGSESMRLMYLMSIAAARESIRFSTAYFVPDKQTLEMLVEARRRGVRVQIIVPGAHTDKEFVRKASRARWGDLLKAGVEIYEYQPTMYHFKLMVVDGLLASIGSSNLDNRSFRLNDEANLNVLDAGFAAEQGRIFEEDLEKSERVTLEAWERRPLGEKVEEWVASWFGREF